MKINITLLFVSLFVLASCKTTLQACPDSWIENQMPGGGDFGVERQYYILNGERKELDEFDQEWVGENCNIEKQIVS